MKKLIVSIFILTINSIFAAKIPPGSEAFILKAQSNKLYIKILNGELKGKLAWIDYSIDNPTGKVFSANPVDSLAIPTTDLKSALYIQIPFAIEGVLDSSSVTNEMNEREGQFQFTGLDRYVPISNQDVPDVAEDFALSCPVIPKRKNGKNCHNAVSFSLPEKLIEIIKEESLKVNETPALVASIIQHESLFNVFAENLHEKKKCQQDEANCSPYRWGVGLAQLGLTDASLYGLDWNKKVKSPRDVRKKYH